MFKTRNIGHATKEMPISFVRVFSQDSTNGLQRQGAVAAAASAPVAIEVLDHPDAKLHPGSPLFDQLKVETNSSLDNQTP